MGLKSCMQLPVDRLLAHMLGQAARPHALSTVELETRHAFREGRLVRCKGHASCRAEGRERCARSGYLSDWEQYLDMISGYAATVPFMTLEGVRARLAPPSAWSCVQARSVQTTRKYIVATTWSMPEPQQPRMQEHTWQRMHARAASEP